jgi:hypothetical protein
MLAGFLVLTPAQDFARHYIAWRKKVKPNEVPDDDTYGMTAVFAVVVYVFLWWFASATGILAAVADQFR